MKVKPIVYGFEFRNPSPGCAVLHVSMVFSRAWRLGAKNPDGSPKNEGEFILTLDAPSVDPLVLTETTFRALLEALDLTRELHPHFPIIEAFAEKGEKNES